MTKDDDLFKKHLMIVKDPDLLRDLQEAAYRKNGSGHGAASRMKEDLHAQKLASTVAQLGAARPIGIFPEP
ncbi:hypothetical protein [Marinobacter maritimus]|uniref:hypothetical protein n=1 Tax=Marinobacter maritimus TaxID=277961 RepID=UPI0011A7A65C|nr:hypothetical protein [Marinobacter maritimus]